MGDSFDVQKILNKHPERIPIIINISDQDKLIKTLSKKKYLVPKNLRFGQFSNIIRHKIVMENRITPETALFYFLKDTLVNNSIDVGHLYKEHKDDDGILYITIQTESTFGYKLYMI